MTPDPLVDDAVLPAAAFLTSPSAADVIAPAIAATGAALVSCVAQQVQYRPGSDLVVRYRVESRDPAGRPARWVVLAGTTVSGPHPGCLPVEATAPDGRPLSVGVWRWPFDPLLTGLSRAVTPGAAAEFLSARLTGPLDLEVVVYRPTERAVVRARDRSGRCVYVKVVPPGLAPALVARHAALGAAGLPVPEVLASDFADGLVALAEVGGPTLRDLLKGAPGRWPAWSEFERLRERLASVRLDGAPVKPPRRADVPAHAGMLASVLPSAKGRLDRLADRLASAVATEMPATIHGDLHEAQVIVHGGRITGLLDLDDVAPGDPFDDVATVLGHLIYRSVTERRGDGRTIRAYAAGLRAGFVPRIDPDALDRATAAVLVGLATGPFRVQMEAWQDATLQVLAAADALMRDVSDPPHRAVTRRAHAQLVGHAGSRSDQPESDRTQSDQQGDSR